MKQYASYLRVSTRKQGTSGLGLEAQRKMCTDFVFGDGEISAEFSDVESGTHRDRKGLWQAIEYCQKNKCPLVVAKLDRLARDVEFCFKVINTGIEIHFCDMPQINTLLLGVFASVAQYERELTSDRTKKALAAKKARGEKTGGASDKWLQTFNNKTKEQIKEESMKRGEMKNARYLASRDVQAFLKIIGTVFPDACTSEDAALWDWSKVTTKGEYKMQIFRLMKDYRDMDGMLFAKWDLEDLYNTKLHVRLAAHILNVRKSLKHREKNKL